MVIIEKNDGFSGIIYGPNITYTCNWKREVSGKTFEIDENKFNQKVALFRQGKPFEYETLDVELPDYMWLELAMQAHEKDITLNKYIEYVLQLAIDNLSNV